MKSQEQIQAKINKLRNELLHAMKKRDAAEYESDVRIFGRLADSKEKQIKILEWAIK